jgi:hypothetical protein
MPTRFSALPAAALAGLLSLAACAGHEEARIGSIAEIHPTPAHYSLCHGNGCRLHTDISLSTAEWQGVRAIFTPPATDAVVERKQISLAVGRLEILAGRQASTLDDAPGMGVHWEEDGQLDCVDETVNTTQDLRMFAADGLLRFHHAGAPGHRFVLSAWGPSNTATVIENATGKVYAVDSYFLANGEPASVVPLDLWVAGWVPEDGPPPAS